MAAGRFSYTYIWSKKEATINPCSAIYLEYA
jgi:hypothetical protein